MIKINKIKSAYIVSIFFLIQGLFLLFHEMFGLKLDNSEVSIYIIKERATYYLMSALLIFQLYMASAEYYMKLVNTLSLVVFVFMFMQPMSDILTHPTQTWFHSAANLFLITLMQIEKYYYK
ncbi:hypothetical protein OAQ16_00855 [Flavobacteriales bacterium]|nr:hypothetical protein [Flavobacteriales bacterium]